MKNKVKIKYFFSKEFLKFVFVGGVAAILNFVSRFFFSLYLSYAFAITASYGIGIIIAFILNKIFVFKKKGETHVQVFWFIVVNIIAYIQILFIALLFRSILFPIVHFYFYPEAVAHFIGLASTTITSYLLHKFLTFRNK
jgi:putative flippase GtrA